MSLLKLLKRKTAEERISPGLPSLIQRGTQVNVHAGDLVAFLFEGNGAIEDRFAEAGYVEGYSNVHVTLSNLSTTYPSGEPREYPFFYRLLNKRTRKIDLDKAIDYEIVQSFKCTPNAMPL